jgi:hypothetical protein
MKRIWTLAALLFIATLAHAQTYSATLSWQPGTGSTDPNAVVSYTPMRSGAAAGPFTVLASVSASPYTDSTVTAGSTYYYEVIATDTAGNVSAPSNVVMGTIPGTAPPPPPAGSTYLRYGTSASYTDPSGNVWNSGTCPGSTNSTSHAITSTTTQPLYQFECYGKTFTLTISGLTAGAGYTLTGKFAELYWGSAGSRVFSVTANGAAWLTAFDIFKDAGGEYIADDKSTTVTASSTGTVTLSFTTTTDNAKIDALSLVPTGSTPPPPLTLGISCSGLTCTLTESNIPSGTKGTVSATVDGATASTTVTIP